jgi:hypothetical protein
MSDETYQRSASPTRTLAQCVVVLALLVCGLLLFLSLKIQPHSDKSLALQFAERRIEMERLRLILASEPSIRTVQRHAEFKNTLLVTDSAGRTNSASKLGDLGHELHRLFNVIGCDYASQDSSEVIIAFPRNGIEDLYPGGVMVYAFCSNEPAFLVDSIDIYRRKARGKYGYYQPLEESWYIKYEEAH